VLATRRHRERGRHGHDPMARLRDDAGAVAILVALSVSTFLLGFAALAVDFGQVYTRQGELQSVADAVALAGATELPDIPEARRKAVETLCAPANRDAAWPEGTCPADLDEARWANDGDAADGEILFYGEPNNLGEFAPPALTRDSDQAMAIQVKLPPSTVTFGLARTFGADDLQVTKAATARVGTPIGTGFLPFAVTPEDLSQDSRNRQFCVVDAGTTAAPEPTGPFPVDISLDLFDSWIFPPTSTDDITVRPRNAGRLPTTEPVYVVVGGRRIEATNHSDRHATVEIGSELAPGRYDVWVEAGEPRSFVSRTTTLIVVGIPRPGAGGGTGDAVCDRPDARGVLDIGRNDPTLDENDTLSANIKQGIEPTPHRYNEHPNTLLLGIDDVLGLQCGGGIAGLVPLLSVVLGIFRADINCVQSRDRGFADGLTEGLLGTGADPGRLLRRCPGGDPVTTRGVTIDGTDLQEVTDENVMEGLPPITEIIEEGSIARGAITAEAFACPRLGIVPVINPGVPPLNRLPFPDGQYPIVDFAYVWIQDDADGLIYEDDGNRLRAVKFWVIDPRFFGRTVSGSPKVGPYLGPQFPREVLLVKNPGED
jgi:hypothetical protein